MIRIVCINTKLNCSARCIKCARSISDSSDMNSLSKSGNLQYYWYWLLYKHRTCIDYSDGWKLCTLSLKNKRRRQINDCFFLCVNRNCGRSKITWWPREWQPTFPFWPSFTQNQQMKWLQNILSRKKILSETHSMWWNFFFVWQKIPFFSCLNISGCWKINFYLTMTCQRTKKNDSNRCRNIEK